MAIGNICVCLSENAGREKKEKAPKKKVRLATDMKADFNEKETKTPETINVSYTSDEGADNISISVVAADEIQARDFICSLYYSFMPLTGSGELSFYTRQHHTLTMITETKRYIERVTSNPTDVKIKCTNDEVCREYTFVLSQKSDHKISLNLHFSCTSYDNASKATGADIVLAIINSADSVFAQEKVARVANSLGNRPVTWVFTGFARENIYYSDDLDIAPAASVRRQLKEKFASCFRNGDMICYAQQYGSLVIQEHEGSLPVYTTIPECREYTPVACGLPFAYAFARFKEGCDEERFVVHKISNMLNAVVSAGREISSDWHEEYMTSEEV